MLKTKRVTNQNLRCNTHQKKILNFELLEIKKQNDQIKDM